MLAAGDRVLVALSGGPDSVALLAALATLATEYGIELCAAHLNHQLRGGESLRDEDWAQRVAAGLGVRCVVERTQSSLGGSGLEARARAVRYAFLSRVAAQQRCTRIATGHTMDDQAETVLMRLMRGAGWDGLGGIPPVREGWIIRPLIACTRPDVLAFLAARGLPYCMDSSNQDARFLRNRVRREVVPVLQSIAPGMTRRLAGFAAYAREQARRLDLEVQPLLASARAADGGLDIAGLMAAPVRLRSYLLRAWLRVERGHLRGLSARHVAAVEQIALGARPNRRVALPGGELVLREYGWLRLRAGDPGAAVPAPRVLSPGSTVAWPTGWRISAAAPSEMRAGWQPPADLWEMVADGDALRWPLMIRTPVTGDRIHPLGVNGRRKLQDVFVDRKLPLRLRRSRPVVECAGEILWVPGLIRSDHALIKPATRSIVRLVAEKTDVAGG